MAEQQLNIKLNVIDNATKAFKSVKDSIFNLRTALLGIGSGAVVKSILNVGSQAQRLKNQFLLLSPSIEEGRKSFEALQKFTATSPLQSDSIERASEIVVVFSKNSQELTDNLFAIQNAAIALGIDIETVAREFSTLSRTGIEGARELKRRNLEAFLGLKEGVKVSSQETVRLFLEAFGKGGKFSLASEAFANTFAGATNRFRNSIKQIQESVAQAGLLDFFTDLTNVFSDVLRKNPELLNKFIKDFTFGLIEGIKAFASFTSSLIELLKEPFNVLVMSIKGINDLLNLFPQAVKEIGIVGFFLLGKKGKAIALAIGFIIKAVEDALEKLGIKSSDVTKSYEEQKDNLILQFDLYKALEEKAQERINKEKEFNDNLEKTKSNTKEISSIFEKILYDFNQLNASTKTVTQSIAEGLNKALGDFSRGIAESIVLGKSLQSSFKSIAQSILIDIISAQIKTLANLATQIVLEKIITQQKQQQAFFSQFSGIGGGIFGSIGKIFGFGGMSSSASALSQGFSFGGIAEGGQVQAGMPYTVGERGRELFVPQTDGKVIPNHDLGGGTILNFNINATDVRGVRELLLNNRATITNIVNQALNAKGKSNLV